MSPELIDPEEFGLEKSDPTKPTDCYALGMVTYQTISGELPFQKFQDTTVCLKVMQGYRPPRGSKFTDPLWKTVESCWARQPQDRPIIQDILRDFEAASNSLESLPSGHSGGMEEGGALLPTTTG